MVLCSRIGTPAASQPGRRRGTGGVMDTHIEHDIADEIRRLLAEDERFPGVSGATAFRHVNIRRGWTDAGYFSFERDGRRYFVTVERAT